MVVGTVTVVVVGTGSSARPISAHGMSGAVLSTIVAGKFVGAETPEVEYSAYKLSGAKVWFVKLVEASETAPSGMASPTRKAPGMKETVELVEIPHPLYVQPFSPLYPNAVWARVVVTPETSNISATM